VAEPDPVESAKAEVLRLRDFANQRIPPPPMEVTSLAMQFLREFAPGSTFEESAERAFQYYNSNSEPIRGAAQQLEEWVP
jgi:hypothetical protein